VQLGLGHGEPETGHRGQVERGLRVAGHGPRRRLGGQRLVLLPGAVGALVGGQPTECPGDHVAWQAAQIVELTDPEAGGVHGRDDTVGGRRPATGCRLPGSDPLDDLLGRLLTGA
jgi:hypothetical protein